MNAESFVKALASINLDNVFNPYTNHCEIYDLPNAAKLRRTNLISYLKAIEESGVDTIWMGRDLGYRGGRRTGLALTDEFHLPDMKSCYPGSTPERATNGPVVVERTATEIWAVIRMLAYPPLLWNVFPFHPHDPDQPLTNRKFTKSELKIVDDLNRELVQWLRISRIISIGQDAAIYAASFGVNVETVRHPSYGGVRDFRAGVKKLYGSVMKEEVTCQPALF
jgi:hypothetical protein